jgi:hypothetical protein
MGQIKGTGLLACRLTASVPQSIPNAGETPVGFDTEDYDIGSLHDTVTNNSRITIPAGTAAKYYLITGMVRWASNNGGLRGFYLKKNNTTYLVDHSAGNLPAADFVMQFTDIVSLVGGDYIELRVYQSSGAALNVQGNAQGAGSTRFVLREIR